MDNNMLYTLFENTLSKMDDKDLENSLAKAKNVLSASDFEKLSEFIKNERKGK